MNMLPKHVVLAITDAGGIIARLVVGGMFIYTGLSKGLDPVAFLKLLRQYEIVHTPLLLNMIAGVLPWFEVFCGSLLVAGVAVRGTAVTVLAMLIPFTIVVLRHALRLQAAANIPFCAVKFDCGCGTGEVYICAKLIENAILVFLTIWLAAGAGRKLALRYQLLR
ncbi:MAG: DoxX family membrane protein [Verrucomicrobiae bacterium]|nr:DoxX family membrane protein [Verrucomicrobiae bacterium]